MHDNESIVKVVFDKGGVLLNLNGYVCYYADYPEEAAEDLMTFLRTKSTKNWNGNSPKLWDSLNSQEYREDIYTLEKLIAKTDEFDSQEYIDKGFFYGWDSMSRFVWQLQSLIWNPEEVYLKPSHKRNS